MKHTRLFLLVALLLCLINSWAHNFEVDGIYYNILSKTDKTLEVTYKDDVESLFKCYSGKVVIPSMVTRGSTTYSVVAIGEMAFWGNGVTEVIINKGITTIGRGAFYDCTRLASVNILSDVTSIGNAAFEGCSSLVSVNIPNSVASIGPGTFQGCSSLISINIPNGVTSIGYSAFEGCSMLSAIEIPNSVTSIGYNAFYGCSRLLTANISESVTSIEKSTFEGCSGLTSINLPDGLTSIGFSAFSGCSSLTSVDIPNSVSSIGRKAFYGSGLASVRIPNGVTSIESSTFAGCSALTSLIIPHSVMSIGNFAFEGCSALTSLVIPNSVISIGSGAFQRCSNLISVLIPNSVTSIGFGAFQGCSNLNSVVISDSVKSLGNQAFAESNIKELRYAEGCAMAFKTGMTNLNSVIIPGSVTTIEDGAFQYCFFTSVTNLSLTPQPIKADCFTSYGTLHVLKGCKETYANAEFWKNFTIVEDALLPCAAPLIEVVNGNLVFTSQTKDAVINYDIVSSAYNKTSNVNGEVSFPFYFVTAYATADGYTDSDIVSKTIPLTPGSSGEIDGDMNGDGKVDMQDANIIVNQYLGK